MTKQQTKVNILGTEYTIQHLSEQEDEALKGKDGYCDITTKDIVIEKNMSVDIRKDSNIDYLRNVVQRHEITHAILWELGLTANTGTDEERMCDFIAIQFPKMMKIFKELDIEN